MTLPVSVWIPIDEERHEYGGAPPRSRAATPTRPAARRRRRRPLAPAAAAAWAHRGSGGAGGRGGRRGGRPRVGRDPQAEFESASEDFHTQFADLRERIDTNLSQESSAFGIGEARQDLDAVAAACRSYQEALREIDFPEQALDERDRVIDVVEAHHLVAVNAAAAFTPGEARALLGLWDQGDPELRSAEEALRTALD